MIRMATYATAAYDNIRMLIGAIGALYFINSGLTLTDLAIFQMAFSITVIIGEFPLGVLSDKYGHKKITLMAIILSAIYYLMCLFVKYPIVLIVAYVIYGIALALVSGALEAWYIGLVNEAYPNNTEKINYYSHYLSEIRAFGNIFSGAIGAIISFFFDDFSIVFILSSVLMMVLFIWMLKLPEGRMVELSEDRIEFKKLLRHCFSYMFVGIKNRLYLFSSVFFGAALIPIYHYWQPFFGDLYNIESIVEKSSGQALTVVCGAVFSIYSLLKMITNRCVRKKLLSILSCNQIVLYSAIISSLFLAVFCFTSNIILAIIVFAIIHSSISVSQTAINSEFYKLLDKNSFATTISFVSLMTRVTNTIFLLGIGCTISYFSVNFLFFGSAIFMGLVAIASVYFFQNYTQARYVANDVQVK